MSENEKSECGGSFAKALRTLGNNMDGLREFVTTVESYLKERQMKIAEKNASHLTPFYLAMRKLNPEDFPTTKVSDEEVTKRFKGDISINVKDEGDGGKTAQIRISGEGKKDFDRAMAELGKNNQSIQLLYSNTLISLLSSVELFLSQLIHLYYRQFPEAVTSKDKVFSFEDLKGFDSVEDARAYLIEAKVENVLRGSFEDWMSFFKTQPKLSMGYLNSAEAQLTEACQRRNLIVHNGGIVNSIYLSKVLPEIAKKNKKGDQLLVSPKYLKDRVDLFELNGSLIAFEMWKKLSPTDEKRGQSLINIIFSHLSAGRWAVSEGLAFFLMNDKEMSEESILIGKLNYWLSVKRQNRWAEIKTAAEDEDMSAKSQRFQLGWLALCEKLDEFFTLLPKVISSKQLSREELRDFPIFEEVRKDKRCNKFLPKELEKAKQTEK
ncbi:MAG TPA: hypothetical protein VFC17_09880 [Candidatus Limnocylindrales bacterium]|nr:hypothetical protein [Candidatus Limnocylindrales bacterium]